jgi:hypothetical protein
MKRSRGLALLSAVCAIAVGACAHIHDDGIGEGRSDRVSIAHPQNGVQVTAEHLDVEGTSGEGSVQVAVYDLYDRLVTRTSIAVRDGRWATRFHLRDGRYRIRANNRREEQRSGDEVRVSYRDESLRALVFDAGGRVENRTGTLMR